MDGYLYKLHIKGIQHIGIPTQKYEQTIDFYKSLGFEVINQEEYENHRVSFLRIHNVMLEVYESDVTEEKTGSIDHIALGVDKVDRLFEEMQDHYHVLSSRVEQLPYWKNGIRFFKVEGPNHEVIEFCQML
ncbi:MAG: VOC family protein [Acetatifactor sp.]